MGQFEGANEKWQSAPPCRCGDPVEYGEELCGACRRTETAERIVESLLNDRPIPPPTKTMGMGQKEP